MWFIRIFFKSVVCLFILWTVYLAQQKLYVLIVQFLVVFSFMVMLWVWHRASKNARACLCSPPTGSLLWNICSERQGAPWSFILGSWEVLEKFIYWEEGKLLLFFFCPLIYFLWFTHVADIYKSGTQKGPKWIQTHVWWAPGPTGQEALDEQGWGRRGLLFTGTCWEGGMRESSP